MKDSLEIKLKSMLWDLPQNLKTEKIKHIKKEPTRAFQDEQLLSRVLNSLNWYELVRLLGTRHLLHLLTDKTINKLYPVQRRIFYTNARRLLSKYTVSTTRQSA